jgi:hypothetical protein
MNLHHLEYGPAFEAKVGSRAAVDLHDDVRQNVFLETLEFRLDAVLANGQVGNGVIAGIVGKDNAREAGAGIDCGDPGARDYSIRFIHQAPKNLSGSSLPVSGGAPKQDNQKNNG